MDLNEACIQICRERFRYVDGIGYHVNDGSSLAMVPDGAFDVVASWDSFVHIDREIVERYVAQIHAKLRRGGIAWLHHAAAGPSDHGWRSNMSAALMRDYAVRYGLLVRAQIFRFPIEGPPPSYNDCISILTKP